MRSRASGRRCGRPSAPSTSTTPRPGTTPGALLHARDAPVPVGQPAHGARPQLHARRRRHALPAPERAGGAASDGVRLVRAARRERGDPRGRQPARDHRAEHRLDHATRCAAWAGRSTGIARSPPTSRRTTTGRSGCSCASSRRARLSQGGAGQLVPERSDRARERARRRRKVLALRRGRRAAEHGAVVLQDHRLRRRAARRPATTIDWPERTKKIQTQLDRPLRRRRGAVPGRGARPRHPRLHDAARHAVRRDVLRRRA